MTDRNELIASLKGRIWGGVIHKGGYIHVPQEDAEAILELLKGREPKPVKIVYNAYGFGFYHCPNCNREFLEFYTRPKFCSKCGQEVKWDA